MGGHSLTRKATGLAPVTNSKLHRPKIINTNDMVVNKNMSTSHSADLLQPESYFFILPCSAAKWVC